MKTVVGTFTSQAQAERAVHQLRDTGIPFEHINLLTPDASLEEIERVPTSDTEQPGMGPAIGGVVGGAVGASGGLLGAAVVSAMIPGIGPVTAVGTVVAALLGVGGVAAGAVAGGALEDAMSEGLPKDELFVYEDALKQGRTVLIVLTDNDDQRQTARGMLTQAGAESLDAARDKWWIGVRDSEAEVYNARGGDFSVDERVYRQGFEAALQPGFYAKPYEDVMEQLRRQYGSMAKQQAFRDGYERGHASAEALHKRYSF